MFYRYHYEVIYSFQDAISATRSNRQRSKIESAKFVGKVLGELKIKASNFEEANAMVDDEVSSTRWGIRALKGKTGEAKMNILGSEVLVNGEWYDTSLVCQKCLNGVPHEHGRDLYIGMGITGDSHAKLEFAA